MLRRLRLRGHSSFFVLADPAPSDPSSSTVLSRLSRGLLTCRHLPATTCSSPSSSSRHPTPMCSRRAPGRPRRLAVAMDDLDGAFLTEGRAQACPTRRGMGGESAAKRDGGGTEQRGGVCGGRGLRERSSKVKFAVEEKDLESHKTLWALYERWCEAFNHKRDHDEKVRWFNTFKKTVLHIHNKPNMGYRKGITEFADGKLREPSCSGLLDLKIAKEIDIQFKLP
ncbi:hypothetical protein ZWY2020_014482 [Hordeum vulgare]|nr:hypothetical protein ZWY2020_014482 [Hordeum vulgare]